MVGVAFTATLTLPVGELFEHLESETDVIIYVDATAGETVK
jgi:hypothetical protein